MGSVTVIAFNTFRENLRDKILYNLLLFALLLIGMSVLLGTLTIAEQEKIVSDLGLAAINLVGVLIAIFVGVGLVSKEIERRTVYTIMARPISRSQFILGKYLGLVLTLLVNLVIMASVFLSTLWMQRAPITPALFQAVQLIFVELLIMTALALFFSTFSSATLSATLALALYAVGHLTQDLKAIAEKSRSAWLQSVMSGLYYLCPNLEALNIKGVAAAGVGVPWSYQAMASLYGLLYAGLLIAGACLVFQKRDF